MEAVNTGWLKNKNGEKFAPMTLTSQIITTDGEILENAISDWLNKREFIQLITWEAND